MRLSVCGMVGLTACFVATIAPAQDVNIAVGKPQVEAEINGQIIVIRRGQDTAATLSGEFARTSRPCPDFCIQPMSVAKGVMPLGELEVLHFIETDIMQGTGLLIDARLPDWFAKGALPAAVNVPFAALDPENPYAPDILRALGAKGDDGALDFSQARDLVVYDNGPWDAQGTRAVRHLIAAGYPVQKIQNYRGGVQSWLHLSLTLTSPAS